MENENIKYPRVLTWHVETNSCRQLLNFGLKNTLFLNLIEGTYCEIMIETLQLSMLYFSLKSSIRECNVNIYYHPHHQSTVLEIALFILTFSKIY